MLWVAEEVSLVGPEDRSDAERYGEEEGGEGDDYMGRSPREIEQDIDRKLLRLAIYGLLGMFLLWVATIAIAVALLHGQANVLHHLDKDDRAHRVRNEEIHSCLVQKYDSLRLDIHNLLLTKPGEVPQFPGFDGIVCPPINPITGKTEPLPFRPPSSTTPTTISGGTK